MDDHRLQQQIQHLLQRQQSCGLPVITTRASSALAGAAPAVLPLQYSVSTASPAYLPVASTSAPTIVCVIPQSQLQPIVQPSPVIVGGGTVPGMPSTVAAATSYQRYLPLLASQQAQTAGQPVNAVSATLNNLVGTRACEELISSLSATNDINSYLVRAAQQRLGLGEISEKQPRPTSKLVPKQSVQRPEEMPSSGVIFSPEEPNNVKRKRNDDHVSNKLTTTDNSNNKKPRRNKKPRDLPRRSLTAYNIFFRQERAKIIGETSTTTENNNGSVESAASSRTSNGKKRKRPHNKVSFEGLAKIVSSRWKELNAAERKPYEELAAADAIQHQKNIDNYIKRKLEEEEAERQKRQLS